MAASSVFGSGLLVSSAVVPLTDCPAPTLDHCFSDGLHSNVAALLSAGFGEERAAAAARKNAPFMVTHWKSIPYAFGELLAAAARMTHNVGVHFSQSVAPRRGENGSRSNI